MPQKSSRADTATWENNGDSWRLYNEHGRMVAFIERRNGGWYLSPMDRDTKGPFASLAKAKAEAEDLL